MPLDPNIILQSTPVPSYYQQYGQLLQLRNAQQQGQLQQAQLQGANLQNQQQQIQLNAEQTLDKAYQSAFTTGDDGNPSLNQDKLSSYLAQNGAGHLLPQVMKGFTDMKKSAADAVKANADAQTANADLAGSAAAGVRDAGYDPNILIAKVAYLDKQGAIPHAQAVQTTAQVQQIVQQNQGNPDAVKTAVKALVDPLIAASPAQRKLDAEQLTAQGAAQRGAAAQTEAGLKQEQADTQRAANVLVPALAKGPQAYQQVLATLPPAIQAKFVALGPNPTQQAIARVTMTGEQQTQADQAAANAAEAAKRDLNTANYQRIETGLRAQGLQIEGARLKIEQQKAQGPLADLNPGEQGIAQKLATGEYDIKDLARFQNKEAIIAGAMTINPGWTPQIYQGLRSFTDPQGQQAKNIQTIGRIVGHIGRFEQNSKDLGVAPVFGMAGVNLGGTAKSLGEDAHAISGELEKLVSGGVGSEGQIQQWQSDLRSTFPSVRQRAVDELSQLVGSQYEAMNQAYKSAAGADLPARLLSAPVRAWMKAKGINIGSNEPSVTAPSAAPAPPQTQSPHPSGLQHMSTDDLFKALNK